MQKRFDRDIEPYLPTVLIQSQRPLRSQRFKSRLQSICVNPRNLLINQPHLQPCHGENGTEGSPTNDNTPPFKLDSNHLDTIDG